MKARPRCVSLYFNDAPVNLSIMKARPRCVRLYFNDAPVNLSIMKARPRCVSLYFNDAPVNLSINMMLYLQKQTKTKTNRYLNRVHQTARYISLSFSAG